MRIFGREPVYLLGFIAAALEALSAFGVDLSAGTQTAITATTMTVAVTAGPLPYPVCDQHHAAHFHFCIADSSDCDPASRR